MSKKIRKSRRKEIKAAVLNVLKSCDKITLPIDIEYIIENMENVILMPYSKVMEKYNLSYEEMLLFAASSDGFTEYHFKKNSYIAFYNDTEKLIKTRRYRFTIAHELGHIALQHHLKIDKAKLFRSSLSDEEYDILESEADYFASLILVPHIVLAYSKKVINAPVKIAQICDISRAASNVRFAKYKKWLKHQNIHSSYDKQILYLFRNYMYKYKCNHCGNLMVFRIIKYCSYCGSTELNWSGDRKMIYDIFTYKECPNCKNEEITDTDNFCQICGNDLQNHCTNPNCNNYVSTSPLSKNARYCHCCGHQTTFFKKGLLSEWDDEKNTKKWELLDPDNTFASTTNDELDLPF